MATNTPIEWTEATWNPVTGCDKVSQGCKNCYAERMAKRLQAMGQANYRDGFKVSLHKHMLGLPLKWKKPKTIFVNSMSDLFHEDVPDSYIGEVFRIMNQAHWHQFQVLTKRSSRLVKLSNKLTWSPNIWMGVSVENEDVINRVLDLQKIPAETRFLSIEPLIGPIPNIPLDGIHWVIVGGESGPGARLMKLEWVEEILKQCQRNNVPFFFKQWGGINKKKAGRILNGRLFDEIPKKKAGYFPGWNSF